MRSEFEEKTYEQYLNDELVHSKQMFSPGQFLENLVGFDLALLTKNHDFLQLFPQMFPFWKGKFIYPKGIFLKTDWWKELEKKIEYFPKFKLNCFVQVKRPEKMHSKSAAEYSSWNQPYFRFDTFASQQQALTSLAQRTSGNAIVVYACPAFHAYKTLFEARHSKKLVRESNFCEVQKLDGHSRYSFVSPGNKGMAHSEPTPIESRSFEQMLDSFEDQIPRESNLSFLKETVENIEIASEQLGELREAYLYLTSRFTEKVDAELARLFAKIYAFQLVCNAQLLILYERKGIS